ncbi:hypothetical protein ACWOEF_08940 [Enterococcus crotali]
MDKDGIFQWGSIAAFVSLLAAFIAASASIWSSKKNAQIQKEIAQQNIDANLKASARIDWIQNVRLLEVEYIDDSNVFMKCANSIIDHQVRYLECWAIFNDEQGVFIEAKAINKYLEDLENSLTRIQKNYLLLRLYFGKNVEDLQVIDAAFYIKENVERIKQLLVQSHRKIELLRLDNLRQDQSILYQVSEDLESSIEYFIIFARDYNKTEWDRAKIGE